MDPSSSDIPTTESDDLAYGLTKTVLSVVPAAGEIFSLIVVPPIQKRWERWMKSVAEELECLRGKIEGFRVEALGGDDEFVTTLLAATQIAIRNHDQEKLDALRNAVLNCAAGTSIDSDRQALFLGYINDLTPLHLRILKFFDAPRSWAAQRGNFFESKALDVYYGLFKALPELDGPEGLGEQIIADLIGRRLIFLEHNFPIREYEVAEDRRIMAEAEQESRTTLLGRKFLAFIAFPSGTIATKE